LALNPKRPSRTTNSRVYTDVDVRLLFGDMLAKLRRHEARRQTEAGITVNPVA
jgi:predicted secreted Zn-dependent protease